jgi:hypothetical protein
MTFTVRWILKGDETEMKLPAAREALQKAQEVMAEGAEDVSITNPVGETFDIDCFGLITKGMDDLSADRQLREASRARRRRGYRS